MMVAQNQCHTAGHGDDDDCRRVCVCLSVVRRDRRETANLHVLVYHARVGRLSSRVESVFGGDINKHTQAHRHGELNATVFISMQRCDFHANILL